MLLTVMCTCVAVGVATSSLLRGPLVGGWSVMFSLDEFPIMFRINERIGCRMNVSLLIKMAVILRQEVVYFRITVGVRIARRIAPLFVPFL